MEEVSIDQAVPSKGKEEISEVEQTTGVQETLGLPEELNLFIQQLELARMTISSKVMQYTDEPRQTFRDDKFTILNENDQTVLTGDWYMIGEYKAAEPTEEVPAPSFEFVWAHHLRNPESPDWEHARHSETIVDALPESLAGLAGVYLQFEDSEIIRVIQAYAFHALDLEYTAAMWSARLGAYGLFGIHNIQWGDAPLKVCDELQNIVKMVRSEAKKFRKKDPELTHEDSIKKAWEIPEILGAISQYKNSKTRQQENAEEFAASFKRAMANPMAFLNGEGDANLEQEASFQVLDQVMKQLEEEELDAMVAIGDESDGE